MLSNFQKKIITFTGFKLIKHAASRSSTFLLYTGLGAGCLGSIFMVWLWWKTGLPLPCVVASGLVLGYLVASVIVTIPAVNCYLLPAVFSNGQRRFYHFSIYAFLKL